MTHTLTPNKTRRSLLLGGVAASFLAACGQSSAEESVSSGANSMNFADSEWRDISNADWKTRLDPAAYNVLRKAGTERPNSSPLNVEKRDGVFVCTACGLPLFRSTTKYESGTGWPSFYEPIEGALETKPDNTLFMRRTEYHCARCGSHQGHLFNDGPAPTGQRYCNNGVALTFIADEGS